MASMKSQFAQFKRQQELEQETIVKLVSAIDDLTWGLADVKRMQEELRSDQEIIKPRRQLATGSITQSIASNKNVDDVEKGSDNNTEEIAAVEDMTRSVSGSNSDKFVKVLFNQSYFTYNRQSNNLSLIVYLSSGSENSNSSTVNIPLSLSCVSDCSKSHGNVITYNVPFSIKETSDDVKSSSNNYAREDAAERLAASSATTGGSSEQEPTSVSHLLQLFTERIAELDERVVRMEQKTEVNDENVRMKQSQKSLRDDNVARQSQEQGSLLSKRLPSHHKLVDRELSKSMVQEKQFEAVSSELFKSAARIDQHDGEITRFIFYQISIENPRVYYIVIARFHYRFN